MNAVVRLNLIVKGLAEESFVKQVLGPYLAQKGIFVVASRLTTSRSKRAKGGLPGYPYLKNDVTRWMSQDKAAYCSTMFDLYRLPDDFPDYQKCLALRDPRERIKCLEDAMSQDISDRRFIPNLLLHEFEALLFSDLEILDETLTLRYPSRLMALREEIEQFGSPEQVDGTREGAPSKRLKALYPGYDKVFFGPIVAENVGIETIRSHCAHFDEWIARLEQLSV